MVVSKEQQAEDKMLNELAAMVKKLTTGMETLNGVQTQAVATMIKEIAQRNGISLTTKRHTLDVKRETELGHKALDVKEKLKIADTYLVRLRHRLNIQMEREHGQQVRRNINLRHNMDNFNEGLNKAKQAIMGGAGFQSALGTTVKKMAGMTRSYQEHEIAQKELAKSTVEAQTAFDNLQMMMGDTVDEVTKQEGEVKTAELKLSGHEEQVKDTGKAAQGTQGMFKPLFEKLGKLGDFLGKKAVPIGIGIGVAGIFMSIIVKAFSASPLFAAMMKMMKFMVTLILMPIGTFFGALLRPILIMLLRKLIIPMYSEWMPKMMKWGSAAGEVVTSVVEQINPSKNNMIALHAEAMKTGQFDDLPEGTDNPDEDWFTTMKMWMIANMSFMALGSTGYVLKDTKKPDSTIGKDDEKVDPYDDYLPDDYGQTDFEDNSEQNPLYVKDQHTWGGGEGLPEYVNPITPNEDSEKTREQKEIDLLINNPTLYQQNANMKNQVDTGGVIEDALAPITEKIVNKKYDGTEMEGLKYSRITDAGISEGAYDTASEERGHVKEENYSQATKDLLASMRSGVIPAANGFEGMVNSPTMFLAGEAGSEHVSITPSGGSSSGGITVNIQNMNGSDNDLRKLKKTILEVIQESSANRGRL